MGGGNGAPERVNGWIAYHWLLLDLVDRAGDYRSHRWLANRGIYSDVYGHNEYQETIMFDDPLTHFKSNGIARNYHNELVRSPDYPDHYIVNNNAPRWSSVINYDWLSSAVLGDGISQDNIGGAINRIGPASMGRYDDYDSAKFCHYLKIINRLPKFCHRYRNFRDYLDSPRNVKLRRLLKSAQSPQDVCRCGPG